MAQSAEPPQLGFWPKEVSEIGRGGLKAQWERGRGITRDYDSGQ